MGCSSKLFLGFFVLFIFPLSSSPPLVNINNIYIYISMIVYSCVLSLDSLLLENHVPFRAQLGT